MARSSASSARRSGDTVVDESFVPTPEQIAEYTDHTQAHIRDVQRQIRNNVIPQFEARAERHDASKLYEPELSGFIQLFEVQKTHKAAFGTAAYSEALAKYKPVIAEHWKNNDHHPEHTETGGHVRGMNLFSLMEWMVDGWCACQAREDECDFAVSLWSSKERFQIESDTFIILWNTALALGYVTKGDDGHEYMDAHVRCMERGMCKREDWLDE